MINKKRAEGNAFGSFLRFRYYKISVDSALMLEYYFFTIDMFTTKGLHPRFSPFIIYNYSCITNDFRSTLVST